MARYLIESQHTAGECLQVMDAILMMGIDFLDRFDFGCQAGEHMGWAVVEAESESAALRMVPAFVRSKARIVEVSKYTPQQIRAAHKEIMQKSQKKTEKSLYERLGGYDVIAAVVKDYVTAIRADPQFSRFSGGRGTDKKNRDLQLNIDMVCALTGGTCYYMGRDMKTAHAGLGITESEWEANIRYMAEALDKSRVPQKEKEEVLTIIKDLKEHIVEK